MANWAGAPNFATRKQLLSSINGVYIDISGITIDVSGIVVTEGIVEAPFVSLSTLSFKGLDSLLDLDVSFDLGLGDAIGGVVGGLGGLIGGALIGVGAGAGAAVSGAAQGIATMVAPRGQNFISQNSFETINFTTQLQVSTIGNADPIYSTIFRTVSSISANQVPGREIFVSSFFLPGQICIRSVSDPFNLITGDSNLNTSTIQSFGQWVPFDGLEPENIVAQSVSTVTLEAQVAAIEVATFNTTLTSNLTAANVLVTQAADFNYQVPLQFELGDINQAAFVGNLNRLYAYTDTGIIFTSDSGFIQENASLMLGFGGESLLTVSSITAPGFIQATAGFFSSLTVETLTVISTINTTSTNVENITSTATLFANTAFIDNAFISTLDSFKFNTGFNGVFDITKTDTVVSTTFNSISSLTNNILNYTLTADIQDMPSFNLATSGLPVYSMSPTNVGQWGSTICIYANSSQAGTIIASPSNAFTGGTFDLNLPIVPGTAATSLFQVTQQQPGGGAEVITTYQPSTSAILQRYTFDTNGVLQAGAFNPAPYESITSNSFSISQDINDVFITTSDRLVLTAGDIVFNGTLNLTAISLDTLNATTATISSLSTSQLTTSQLNATSGFISTLSTNRVTASNVVIDSLLGLDCVRFKPSTVSFNAAPGSVVPQAMNFTVATSDFLTVFTLIPPFMGSNSFNSYNVSSWNMTVFTNTTTAVFGTPGVFLGDVQSPLGTYAAQFFINNTVVSPPPALPIFVINSSGAVQIGIIAGNTYGRIQTNDGVTWSITSNVGNPQGNAGGVGATYSNLISIRQSASQTTETHTQNYQLQAPQTSITTNQFNLFADAIRVNSRTRGSLIESGLPSYPIGMEIGVYQDENIAWTEVGAYWQSDATNVLLNVTGDIIFDVNAWSVLVIPSRFRTNDSEIVSFDVQAVVISVVGGGFCWGFARYIQVNADIGGPGSGATNYNTYMAFPLNYITR